MIDQIIQNTIGDGTNAIILAIQNMKQSDIDRLLDAVFYKVFHNDKLEENLSKTMTHLLFNNEDFIKSLEDWHTKKAQNISDINIKKTQLKMEN